MFFWHKIKRMGKKSEFLNESNSPSFIPILRVRRLCTIREGGGEQGTSVSAESWKSQVGESGGLSEVGVKDGSG